MLYCHQSQYSVRKIHVLVHISMYVPVVPGRPRGVAAKDGFYSRENNAKFPQLAR